MKNLKGFTLVEIIVALAIFAIIIGGSASLILSGSDVFRKNADMSHGSMMAQYTIDWLEDNLAYSSVIQIVDSTTSVPEGKTAIKVQASGVNEGQLMVYNNGLWEEALTSGFYEGWKIAITPQVISKTLELTVEIINVPGQRVAKSTKILSFLNYESLEDNRSNTSSPYPMFLLVTADVPSGSGSSGDEPTNTVVAYLATSESLLEIAKSMSGNTWTDLRDIYKAEYDGSYPVISAVENEMLAVTSPYTASGGFDKNLTWKPTILGTDGKDGLMMIASNETSPNNAYLIYYEGDYYFHFNGYYMKDSAYITDTGGFDTTLLTNPPSSGSRWIKVE